MPTLLGGCQRQPFLFSRHAKARCLSAYLRLLPIATAWDDDDLFRLEAVVAAVIEDGLFVTLAV